jgi:hypothetical protein
MDPGHLVLEKDPSPDREVLADMLHAQQNVPVRNGTHGTSSTMTGTDLQYHDDAAQLSEPPPQTDHYLAAEVRE